MKDTIYLYMYRPIVIANYFIKKALDTGQDITPMKLLKLVYIAHGYYTALANEDLISEGVQAWKFGPVIPSIYHKFKIFGNEPITAIPEFDIPAWSTNPYETDIKVSELNSLSADDREFLDKIWEVYGHFTGIQLSNMTHKPGTPWYQVWEDHGNSNYKNVLIPNEVIKQHYLELLNSASHG